MADPFANMPRIGTFDRIWSNAGMTAGGDTLAAASKTVNSISQTLGSHQGASDVIAGVTKLGGAMNAASPNPENTSAGVQSAFEGMFGRVLVAVVGALCVFAGLSMFRKGT